MVPSGRQGIAHLVPFAAQEPNSRGTNDNPWIRRIRRYRPLAGEERRSGLDATIPKRAGCPKLMRGAVENLHNVVQIGMLLAAILGAAVGYFRLRGRRFGLFDLLVFGILATVSDLFCYKLLQVAFGSHADSAAYGALAALIALLGLVPISAGLNVIAAVAMVVCLIRYPSVRYGTVLVAIAAWLVHLSWQDLDGTLAPGGVLNSDKLAGENWALESGATTKLDCDRQSPAKAFREGCYARLTR
jgi:hypothetical protein